MSNFFFGKISKNHFPEQLTDGYYIAEKNSSWFGDLNVDDYVFIIGDRKVQFWQAKEYKNDRMNFDILCDDCNITPGKFSSLNFFKLNMELIIKSMRSTASEKKAFFKLELIDSNSDIVEIVEIFKNPENYPKNLRKIILYENEEAYNKHRKNNENNNNIEIYYNNKELEIIKKDFIDKKTLLDNFNGKISSHNGQRKQKTIDKFNLEGEKFKELDILMQDLYDVLFTSPQKVDNDSDIPIIKNMENNTNIPLNQILYGPPGTGKTYNTVNYAIDILDHNSSYLKWEEKKKRFDELRNEGRIVFTTFHQSMCYEDFVEGIKPKIENGNVVYNVVDGIFKTLCNEAKIIVSEKKSKEIDFSKTRIFKMSLGEKGKDDIQIFNYCLENNVVALGWGGNIDFSNCTKTEDFKVLDSSWGSKAIEIFKQRMRINDIILVADGLDKIKGIAKVNGDYEFLDNTDLQDNTGSGICQFRNVEWLYSGEPIPVSKLYNKNLSQQSIYGFYNDKKEGKNDYNGEIKTDFINNVITGNINNTEPQNYLLIIDEINRGNVSQIFGELITLLEEDKRLKNEFELKVKLPYSKEDFGIPSNLYIIGTMNTADRSVEALDTALRRRFSFVEMMPDTSLIEDKKIGNITLKEVLDCLNKRILILKDREHQIGHSYFMKCSNGDDLKNIFKNNIIPLLQEYFYGNYENIYCILGNGFIKVDPNNIVFASQPSYYDNNTHYRLLTNTEWENLDIEKAIATMLNKPKSSEELYQ